MKYKVVKRKAAEFGKKAHVFVIAKKTWLGFYKKCRKTHSSL